MDRPIKKKRWTPKRIAWIVAGVLFATLIGYGFHSAGGGSTYRLDSGRLTVSEVTRGEFLEFIPITGAVMPIKTFYLDAMQGGQVIQIFLREGSFVDVGDKILQLDNTDLQLDIMYREAQLFEQINNLRNTRLAMEQNSLQLRGDLLAIDRQIGIARRDYDQSVELQKKKLISAHEYDRIKEEYDYWVGKRALTVETQRQDSVLRTIQIEQLEASVDRMQSNQKIVKQKLDNLVIKAPLAGQLTSLNAEVGESKSRGERLGQIDVLDGFKVRAAVDEYYISRVSQGLMGELRLDNVVHELKVTKVFPEVRDGRFQIDLEFIDGPPEGIRRGQTMRVRLALGELSEAVTVARGGFFNSTGGNWVYVVDESGEFAIRREIRLGRMNPQVYEVLDGLEIGERVITSSYEAFDEYDKIVFKDK